MTEPQRTALLTACAFDRIFLIAADPELRGVLPEQGQEAAEQLQAALRNQFGNDFPIGLFDEFLETSENTGPSKVSSPTCSFS